MTRRTTKSSDEARPRIELPELFAAEEPAQATGEPEKPRERLALIVSGSAALKNYLTPILRREGCRSIVVNCREELEHALAGEPVDHILVAQEMLEEFSTWASGGGLTSYGAEISVLNSVTASLLDNPVSYGSMVRAVFSAVQMLAGESVAAGVVAPHALIARDVRELARVVGLRRLASDGTQVAAWLLSPKSTSSATPDFGRALSMSRQLNFPWHLDKLVEKTAMLHTGDEKPGHSDAARSELDLAAQILALSWQRHMLSVAPNPLEEARDVKGALRAMSGRLASLDIVEAYIRLIEGGTAAIDSMERLDVIVVTGSRDRAREISTRFGGLGIHVTHMSDLAEAAAACETSPPVAVIVDFATLGVDAARSSVILRLVPDLLVYALVDSGEASFTLDLIDAGFDDVLVPPHDFGVVAARVVRSVRARARGRSAGAPGFGGTFSALSFVDLVQSLSQSRKSVRLDVWRGEEEMAVVFLDCGRLCHARCGDLMGVEAVYDVIAWGDEGAFSVEVVSEFPPGNVQEATEAVLMEGCRLFDESRVTT